MLLRPHYIQPQRQTIEIPNVTGIQKREETAKHKNIHHEGTRTTPRAIKED